MGGGGGGRGGGEGVGTDALDGDKGGKAPLPAYNLCSNLMTFRKCKRRQNPSNQIQILMSSARHQDFDPSNMPWASDSCKLGCGEY